MHQFAHQAAVILVTPDGHVSRYLAGMQYTPDTLKYSLVEASEGKAGTLADDLFLSCYQFDTHKGEYVVRAMTLMRIGGVFTMLLIASFLGFAFYREQKLRRAAGTTDTLPPPPHAPISQ
jgi:protein SCO1/2